MNARILVVEDDAHIRLGLQELLATEHFDVIVCGRGDRLEEMVRRESPDLILLDVMLPKVNGFEACRQLRRSGIRTPVLMLTAKSQELDKVIGLDSGADDYVTKPFGVRELIARIHALLRRSGKAGAHSSSAVPASAPASTTVPFDRLAPFRIGDAEIVPRRFQLLRRGDCLDLTARELQILQLLAAHPGEVLTRDRLLNEVWGQRYLGTTRTLDQVIVQLRRKLGDPAHDPRHLLTVHGVGYKLAV
ncbi:MAG: response regulator transcription factor [Limisphaerales bacterium]